MGQKYHTTLLATSLHIAFTINRDPKAFRHCWGLLPTANVVYNYPFFLRSKGQLHYARKYFVGEKHQQRHQIADSKNTPYRIGLYTLHKMCVARDLTLEDFFRLIKR